MEGDCYYDSWLWEWLWALLLIPTTGAMATEIMTKDRGGAKERKSKHSVHTLRHPNPTVNMENRLCEASWTGRKRFISITPVIQTMISVQAGRKGKPKGEPVMNMDVQWIWMRSRQSWRRRRVVRHLSRPFVSDPRRTTNWQTKCPPRKGGQRKKKFRRRERNIRSAEMRSIEKNVLFGEEEKAELGQRADDQLKVQDTQEREFLTNKIEEAHGRAQQQQRQSVG